MSSLTNANDTNGNHSYTCTNCFNFNTYQESTFNEHYNYALKMNPPNLNYLKKVKIY